MYSKFDANRKILKPLEKMQSEAIYTLHRIWRFLSVPDRQPDGRADCLAKEQTVSLKNVQRLLYHQQHSV